MYADRVEVLHITDGDTVAVLITHHFVFNLLPAGDAALNQYHLVRGCGANPEGCDRKQMLAVIGNATAVAAQGICRTNNYRVTNPFATCKAWSKSSAISSFSAQRLMNALHRLFLKSSRSSAHPDCIGARADHGNIVLLQETGFLQLHRKILSFLAAQSR